MKNQTALLNSDLKECHFERLSVAVAFDVAREADVVADESAAYGVELASELSSLWYWVNIHWVQPLEDC